MVYWRKCCLSVSSASQSPDQRAPPGMYHTCSLAIKCLFLQHRDGSKARIYISAACLSFGNSFALVLSVPD
jgi:hypothetical protein